MVHATRSSPFFTITSPTPTSNRICLFTSFFVRRFHVPAVNSRLYLLMDSSIPDASFLLSVRIYSWNQKQYYPYVYVWDTPVLLKRLNLLLSYPSLWRPMWLSQTYLLSRPDGSLTAVWRGIGIYRSCHGVCVYRDNRQESRKYNCLLHDNTQLVVRTECLFVNYNHICYLLNHQ